MISHEDILNSLEEAILLLDNSMSVIAVNRAAEEELLTGGRQVAGRDVFEVLPWLSQFAGSFRSAVEAGRGCYLKSVTAPRGVTWASLTPYMSDTLPGASVLAVGPVSMSPDERDQLAFESMDGFISQIAHEIKNPLGGIRGASQLLSEKLPGDLAEYLGVIVHEVDRLSGILRELQDFSSPSPPARKAVNVHEVLDRALKILHPEREGITVKRLYDPSLPDLFGDGAKLLQVFLNLIKNAAEALEGRGEEGLMELCTRPAPQYVQRGGHIKRWAEISVRDNGAGISPDRLERIFLPFVSGKSGGSGLGLAIARKILNFHDGMLRVESREGEGAIFKAYIPYVDAPGPGRDL